MDPEYNLFSMDYLYRYIKIFLYMLPLIVNCRVQNNTYGKSIALKDRVPIPPIIISNAMGWSERKVARTFGTKNSSTPGRKRGRKSFFSCSGQNKKTAKEITTQTFAL